MNLVYVRYESSVEYVLLDTLWTVRFIIDTVITAILILNAGVTKRPTVVDSRSTRAGVRGFESLLPHSYFLFLVLFVILLSSLFCNLFYLYSAFVALICSYCGLGIFI